MTEPLYGSHAPVFKVDGDVKHELGRDVIYLEIEENTDGLRNCTARFVNLGPKEGHVTEQMLYFDGTFVDFGRKLEVTIGPGQDQRVVFSGPVSALEHRFTEGGAPEAVIFAEDALMKLRMTRRSKAYENKTDAQIAQEIASRHGLNADADATGPSYDVVQQWNQSDLAFLRARARLIQAEVWADDDTLKFKSRGSRSGTTLTLVAGNELMRVRIRADLAHQRTEVKVSGYDAQARDVIDESAGADEISSEAEGGRTGPTILQNAFGDRQSYRVREVPLTGDEARQWAKAEMLRRARGFVRVNGLARGQPDMVVGSKLELQRVGAPFEGDGYYVTRVCHTFERRNGHLTHFEAERAHLKATA
jgi:phage protein D